MARLADWLEDYRNWRGRQEWQQGKGWQDFFGGDPRAQEQFEKLSGFGTDAGGLVGMIKASHGSPHAFDKFDFSKIGTGEGAQAYGHGGYFAQGFDSPVAQQYKENLSNPSPYQLNQIDSAYKNAAQSMKEYGYSIQETVDALAKAYKDADAKELTMAANHVYESPGHLYNVELRWPDAAREAADPLGEHHLLDWDAPMSEQPHMMKFINEEEAKTTKKALDRRMKTLASIGESHPNAASVKRQIELLKEEMESPSESGVKRLTGGEYFNYLRRRSIDPKAQAEMFLQHGIPGIRYLDQVSRGAGQGTRNYVMFDDALANIVSRNGVSLSDLLRR